MRGRLSIAALVLFVAFDLVLVTAAVRHVQAGPSGGADRAAAASPRGSADPSSDTEDLVSVSPAAQPGPAARTAFLAVGQDRTLLRASRGSCQRHQSAVVDVSTDDGASFTTARVPRLEQVLGIRATSEKDLAVIGLGAGCSAQRFTSTDGGRSWTRAAGGGGTWSLAADPGTVAAPTGTVTPPCTPAAVSSVAETLVRLLCASGKVLGTDDNGDSWVGLGSLPGAVDLRFTSAGEGVALAKQKGCPAAVMESVDGGARWTRLGCVPGTTPLALGSQGSVIAAQVGAQLYVSTDGGKSWPGPTAG